MTESQHALFPCLGTLYRLLSSPQLHSPKCIEAQLSLSPFPFCPVGKKWEDWHLGTHVLWPCDCCIMWYPHKTRLHTYAVSFLAYEQHKQKCSKYISHWYEEEKFSFPPDALRTVTLLPCATSPTQFRAAWLIPGDPSTPPHASFYCTDPPKQNMLFMVSLADIHWAHLLYDLGMKSLLEGQLAIIYQMREVLFPFQSEHLEHLCKHLG